MQGVLKLSRGTFDKVETLTSSQKRIIIKLNRSNNNSRSYRKIRIKLDQTILVKPTILKPQQNNKTEL
jgi:hypothetical protein